MSIEGQVQEFRFRSPHALLLVKARTPGDQVATYTVEWRNLRRLGCQEITRALKPDDIGVVTGSPGRTASEHKRLLKGIRRPVEGWSWRGPRR